MSKRLVALLAGVLAIASIAAGCGSSDDDTTTASITKAEFIKKADTACTKGNEQIESEIEAFAEKNDLSENTEPTEAQKTEIAETILLPAVQKQIDEIRALGAPGGEEDQVDAILTAVDEAVETSEEDPGAVLSPNSKTFTEANELARDYGLEVCGEE